MSALKKNFIYTCIYQIFLLILPIITVPYVSRIFGANGVGVYSYTYSIVYYFTLFSLLGINNYGNREIAKQKEHKKKMSKTFFEIYSIQLFMSIIMILLYIIYVIFFVKEYKIIAFIQSIHLIASMFDINWFFFGIEKFKLTVIRNFCVKIVSLILIFIFVKTKNDIWIYTLILSVSAVISQLLLLPFLKKEIFFEKLDYKNLKKHIRPIIILFIPVISVSVYKVMDKIMLGLMSNFSEVGFYEQAEKIINVPLGIITALGVVMLPRMSTLFSKMQILMVKKYIDKSIEFMMFLAYPICFGIIAVAPQFVPIFLGKGFNETVFIVSLLSTTIIFIAYANIIRKSYLIPNEQEKIFVCSVLIGAILNFLLNVILISKFNAIGASIATIVAEFFVMLYQFVAVRKELPVLSYITKTLPFLLKAIIMFVSIQMINLFNINNTLSLIIKIFLGVMIYLCLNYKYIVYIIRLSRKEVYDEKSTC